MDTEHKVIIIVFISCDNTIYIYSFRQYQYFMSIVGIQYIRQCGDTIHLLYFINMLILYQILRIHDFDFSFICSIDKWASDFGAIIYDVCRKATGLTDLQTVSTT